MNKKETAAKFHSTGCNCAQAVACAFCAGAAAKLLESFRAKNGSVYCRELKGRDTGVPLRSCRGCVEDAAELLEESFRAAGRDMK